MAKMDPEVKKEWLKALRSGEYPKTTGMLCSTDDDGRATGFCCLGVLADIAMPEPWVRSTSTPDPNCLTVRGFAFSLPEGTMGLDKKTQSELTDLNDDNPTFAEVIAYIEENL